MINEVSNKTEGVMWKEELNAFIREYDIWERANSHIGIPSSLHKHFCNSKITKTFKATKHSLNVRSTDFINGPGRSSRPSSSTLPRLILR